MRKNTIKIFVLVLVMTACMVHMLPSMAIEKRQLSTDDGYTVKKVLLSDGANDVTEDGNAFYNKIKDSKLSAAYIKEKGGHYAKCVGEGKVKGKTDVEYYYGLTFENVVGAKNEKDAFLTTGFYDSTGKHHGSTHLVRRFYKKYQEYSQIYSYTKVDEENKIKTYYYFIHVWREEMEEGLTESVKDDVLTYCIEYGEPLSKENMIYTKQKKTYDGLSDKQKQKIALAIYYGPHRSSDGTYYISKNLKATNVTGYDPSTWTKMFWKRYIATQLYIWSVQAPKLFSLEKAMDTAKNIDKMLPTDNEKFCVNFLTKLCEYVDTAFLIPSFCKREEAKAKRYYLTKQENGKYQLTLQDKNGVLTNGDFEGNTSGLSFDVSEDGKTLTIIATEHVGEIMLSYSKKENVPKSEAGLIYYATNEAQNMIQAEVELQSIQGYFSLATTDNRVEEGKLRIVKKASDTKEGIEGACFAVFTTSKRAAIYNPECNNTMTNELGQEYDAKDYIAGILINNKNVIAYSEEEYDKQVLAGKECKLLYNLAYYVENGYGKLPVNSVYSVVTDKHGNAETGDLLKEHQTLEGNDVKIEYGEYVFVEWYTPKEYKLPYPVTINHGKITEATVMSIVKGNDNRWGDNAVYEFENEPLEGSLHIMKSDAVTKTALANVSFGIYKDVACQNLYLKVLTDENGECIVEHLPRGIYYVKELEGQYGYVVESQAKVIKVEAADTKQLEFENVPYTVEIHIQKQSDYSEYELWESKKELNLSGAQFGVYAAEDILGANGVRIYGRDEKIAVAVTNERGKAIVTSDNLRMGKYYVKELKAPEGYELNESIFYIDATKLGEADAGVVLHRYVNVVEKPIGTVVLVHKQKHFWRGKEEILQDMEGAVFSVYDLDVMQKSGIEISKIEEFNFVDNQYDKYRVPISSDLQEPYTVTTDDKGVAKFTKLLNGRYAVVEVRAPIGFSLAKPQSINLPTSTRRVELSFVDELLYGRIQVHKTGDVPIGTETYESVHRMPCNRFVYEQQYIEGIGFEIYNYNGMLVDTIVTNQEGIASSKELPVGNYTIREVKTHQGYYLENKEYQVTIQAEGQVVLPVTVNINNSLVVSELVLEKYGEVVKKMDDYGVQYETQPLEYAIFGLYSARTIVNYQGQVIAPPDMLLGIGVTDKDGFWRIQERLPAGEYYVKELRAPKGYVMSEEKYYLNIAPAGTDVKSTIHVTNGSILKNDMVKATVRLLKTDAAGKNMKLVGAEFGLFNALTGEQIASYVTNREGVVVIQDMPFGKWYFKEIKAPKGYQLSTKKYEFIVDENSDTVIEIVAKNIEEPQLGMNDGLKFSTLIFVSLGIFFILGSVFLGVKILRDKKEET